MKKIFLLSLPILIATALAVASPAQAKITDNPFLAAVVKFVQEIIPGGEGGGQTAELEIKQPVEETEEFVDPREVQQTLREIKDLRRELNRLAKQLKKLPNSSDDLSRVDSLLSQLASFESAIKSETNLRDNIQEFRDAQMWEQMNKFRAKIEIPKEMKQWSKEIKRVEKMMKQKKYQNLGFDLEKLKASVEEMKAALSKVQEYYQAGDLESAMEEFDGLRQDVHPGEISNVMQRMWEINGRMKTIKDESVKSQIKEVLDEVISNLNEGEYRVARELLDESWNDIMKMIQAAFKIGKKGGLKQESFFEMSGNLEEKMRQKAEEKKAQMEERRQKMEQAAQPAQPAVPAQPAEGGGAAQPAQPAVPAQPATTSETATSSQ